MMGLALEMPFVATMRHSFARIPVYICRGASRALLVSSCAQVARGVGFSSVIRLHGGFELRRRHTFRTDLVVARPQAGFGFWGLKSNQG